MEPFFLEVGIISDYLAFSAYLGDMQVFVKDLGGLEASSHGSP